MTLDDIIDQVLTHEGGFVNDPDDPGGATNWGITIHTLRRIRGQAEIDDIRNLTRQDAIEIYKRDYFYGPRINELPQGLWPTITDMQINAGANAVKILQRLISKIGFPVHIDGMIGPQTLAAAEGARAKIGILNLTNAYGIERRNYYFALADRRPASRKYAVTRSGTKGGWIKRAEHFIDPQYHLSPSEFQDRIAAWA